MEWKIDTGRVGECKAKDLRKVLEAARDHFLDTQATAAGEAVVRAANDGKSPGAPPLDVVALGKKADAEIQAFKAKAAALSDQMSAGIEAACKMADLLGGTVTASVCGHGDARHRSGCASRMSVNVDQLFAE